MLIAARWLISNRMDLLWALEGITDRDIDKDGVKGNPTNKRPTMTAPSGNEVLLKDLLTFAKMAPKVKPTYRGYWEERWQLEYWQDVMDIWAERGCVEQRRPRHTSEWLVDDFDTAAARLFSTYANRPTP